MVRHRSLSIEVRSVVAVFVAAATASSCSSTSDPRGEDVGVARIALSEVPGDVQCLEVVASGRRSVTKRFSLVPGASVTLEMAGLPLGEVHFSGSAFAGSCASSTGSPPTWISDDASATLVSGVVAEVTLIMRRNGRASIRVDFENEDGGAGGVGGAGGSGGNGGEGGFGGTGGNSGAAGGAGNPDAGNPTAGTGGGDDGSLGGSGGSGATDGGAVDGSADGGPITECVPPSPNFTWGLDYVSIHPTAVFAADIGGAWILDGTASVYRMTRGNPTQYLIGANNEFLYALWGSSRADVWAGGTRLHHWNGTRWSDVTPPELLLDPTREVRTLAGRTSDDVWLSAAPLASGGSARLFHWDGSSWTERTPPDSLTGGPAVVSDISVSPAQTAWATARWQANGTDWGGVLRWTGATWEVALSGIYSDGDWHSVWASADDDVWIVGQVGMAHFDGVSWRRDDTAPHIARLTAPVLWGSCGRDIWATDPNAQIWHFDGLGWSEAGLSSTPLYMTTVSGTGPDDVWFASGAFPGSNKSVAHRYVVACGNGRIDPGEACDPPDGVECDATCHRTCVASTGSCGTGTLACCSGLVCSSRGMCVPSPPTCMPDGGVCSPQIPCCSGAQCVNGLCGGACMLDGAACDGSHPCCTSGSTCTNGVCGGVTCVPLGQNCGGPGGCCSGSSCGGAGVCRSQPGGSCADVGITCNVVGSGCCSGSTCVGGRCTVVTGCYPPGQYCNANGGDLRCCSGVCVFETGQVGHCL